jgi:hypothetical protein
MLPPGAMTMNYTGMPVFPQAGEFVSPKFSLTEGSIPRALLAFSLPVLFGNVRAAQVPGA